MRQISTGVAPIRVQMVAPVRTFQMISGAAVLQGLQAAIAQLQPHMGHKQSSLALTLGQ